MKRDGVRKRWAGSLCARIVGAAAPLGLLGGFPKRVIRPLGRDLLGHVLSLLGFGRRSRGVTDTAPRSGRRLAWRSARTALRVSQRADGLLRLQQHVKRDMFHLSAGAARTGSRTGVSIVPGRRSEVGGWVGVGVWGGASHLSQDFLLLLVDAVHVAVRVARALPVILLRVGVLLTRALHRVRPAHSHRSRRPKACWFWTLTSRVENTGNQPGTGGGWGGGRGAPKSHPQQQCRTGGRRSCGESLRRRRAQMRAPRRPTTTSVARARPGATRQEGTASERRSTSSLRAWICFLRASRRRERRGPSASERMLFWRTSPWRWTRSRGSRKKRRRRGPRGLGPSTSPRTSAGWDRRTCWSKGKRRIKPARAASTRFTCTEWTCSARRT